MKLEHQRREDAKSWGSPDLQRWTRPRLGLRQSSAAFGRLAPSESARGLAQSKTWRPHARFMESPPLPKEMVMSANAGPLILLPVDGSETSTRAAEYCAWFARATGGHNVGVVNPPSPESKRKFRMRTRPRGGDYLDPEAFEQTVKEYPGSWWTAWEGWLSEKSSGKVAAPKMGGTSFRPLGDAPGKYVFMR